jgi:hypothetical protein
MSVLAASLPPAIRSKHAYESQISKEVVDAHENALPFDLHSNEGLPAFAGTVPGDLDVGGERMTRAAALDGHGETSTVDGDMPHGINRAAHALPVA